MAISKGGQGGAQRLGGPKKISRPKSLGGRARGKAGAPGQLKKAAGLKSARSFTPAGAKAATSAPLQTPPLLGRGTPTGAPTTGLTRGGLMSGPMTPAGSTSISKRPTLRKRVGGPKTLD